MRVAPVHPSDSRQGLVAVPPSVGQRRGADEKHCFSCGQIIHVSAVSCPSCGAVQSGPPVAPSRLYNPGLDAARSVYCRGCGASIHESAPTCPNCGAQQYGPPVVAGAKERVTAAVLAIFLGGLGAHHFYLGNIGFGIVYLLFCWTLVPAVVGFIEGLVYLSKSDEEFARRYG